MSKDSRAMVAAKVCLIIKQSQREAAKQIGLNSGYIGQAAVVLEYAPELADVVVAGTKPLNEAVASGPSQTFCRYQRPSPRAIPTSADRSPCSEDPLSR
jgi:hypothetical protein